MRTFLVSSILIIGFVGSCAAIDNPLPNYAKEKFGGEPFTRAEIELLDRAGSLEDSPAVSGTMRSGLDRETDPQRRIRHLLIEWLCKNKGARELITPRGLILIDARVEGELDLRDIDVPFPISATHCTFANRISANRARLPTLELVDTVVGSSQNGEAVVMDGAHIGSDLIIKDNTRIRGEFRLQGADIGKDIYCRSCGFMNPGDGRRAFNIEGAVVAGSVILDQAEIQGEVIMTGSQVQGQLILHNGTKTTHLGATAIRADYILAKGGIRIGPGFESNAELSFCAATVSGDFSISAKLSHNGAPAALCINGAKIAGNFRCDKKCEITGQTMMLNSQIDGNLEFSGCKLEASDFALHSEGTKVGGSVVIDNSSKFNGCTLLRGMTIGRSLYFHNATFTCKQDRVAINAHGVRVGGSLVLNQCEVKGKVQLMNARVNDSIAWEEMILPEQATLDLQAASSHTFCDDGRGFPKVTFLDGYHYDRIEARGHADIHVRIDKWLRSQRDFTPDSEKSENATDFIPGPYEQLASALKASGDTVGAREVRIAKGRDQGRAAPWFSTSAIWFNGFGRVCEYGTRPDYAFYLSVIFVLIASYVFSRLHRNDLIIPAKIEVTKNLSTNRLQYKLPPNYPRFHAIMFSLETFIPFFKLDQTTNWIGAPEHIARVRFLRLFSLSVKGSWVCRILWGFAIVGAVMTALWVGALAGISKA